MTRRLKPTRNDGNSDGTTPLSSNHEAAPLAAPYQRLNNCASLYQNNGTLLQCLLPTSAQSTCCYLLLVPAPTREGTQDVQTPVCLCHQQRFTSSHLSLPGTFGFPSSPRTIKPRGFAPPDRQRPQRIHPAAQRPSPRTSLTHATLGLPYPRPTACPAMPSNQDRPARNCCHCSFRD